MKKVFIDGSAGTTGLRIRGRLASRNDIELVTLPDAVRKDPSARRDALNSADIAFLCLPDAAAVEAVAMVVNETTAIIDTSTAHRVSPGWEYGFPELTGRRERIRASRRIANPGCHASGFIALVAPLVERGVLAKDALLSCFSITGYSGGGNKMIAEYEAPSRSPLLEAPRQYGLAQAHKHLPEMKAICGLDAAPAFAPIVAPYYSGMEVTVTLHRGQTDATPDAIRDLYRDYYSGAALVHVADDGLGEGGFLSTLAYAERDDMEIAVSGNADRILLVSRFDNLGKGASGAAIQNMNILLGADEREGLVL